MCKEKKVKVGKGSRNSKWGGFLNCGVKICLGSSRGLGSGLPPSQQKWLYCFLSAMALYMLITFVMTKVKFACTLTTEEITCHVGVSPREKALAVIDYHISLLSCKGRDEPYFKDCMVFFGMYDPFNYSTEERLGAFQFFSTATTVQTHFQF